MDQNLFRQFNRILNREKAKFNKRLAIFTFFLFVSTALWFLIKLSHEYTSDLVYPIKFENTPKGKVIVGSPPEYIHIKAKALGHTLLKYKLMSLFRPIEINLSVVTPVKNSVGIQYAVSIQKQYNNIVEQVASDITVMGIEPKTLYLEFADVVTKKVPVIPIVNATFAKQYMLAGRIKTTPEEVEITGPSAIVDTISSIKTKNVILNQLDEERSVKATLKPYGQTTCNPDRVILFIPVETFTEATLKVPITIEGVPDSVDVIVLPSDISVRFNVVISKYFSVKPIHFKAVVNYSEISKGIKQAKVNIVQSPNYITITDYEPKFVDVLIKGE
ncbi:MAG: hypothetical protein H6537_00695 [Bacteroidales bacterium]|nr:hypothetical protein [Bacteroidales bacterium]HPD95346.1 CdaR family protein [Tenuifilaceae bacterium]HRX30969.1 CdaR family protein [Tenuifilaceae bacterium]